MKLDAVDGASLAWLPQETILFYRRSMSRTIDVSLANDATLLLAEAIVFGRAGMGEAVEHGGCSTAGACSAGPLIYAETLRLDGAVRRSSANRRSRKAAWRWRRC